MKVFVVGANGQTGRQIVAKLVAAGDQVTAGVRKPEEQGVIPDDQVKYVLFDLEWSVAQIAKTIAGNEAIIFAAASTGPHFIRIDLNGAVKTMIAAENSQIKRYLLLSAVGASQPDQTANPYEDFDLAKYYAEQWLMHRTQLDYVILRPIYLTNDAGSGQITLSHSDTTDSPQVSRENLGRVLTALIHHPELSQQAMTISDGQTPIETALKQFK